MENSIVITVRELLSFLNFIVVQFFLINLVCNLALLSAFIIVQIDHLFNYDKKKDYYVLLASKQFYT